MRRRHFTKNLDLAVRLEFERTKTRDVLQRPGRTSTIQQSPGQVADARGTHDGSSPRPVNEVIIRRVDASPRPISSADFGGMLLRRTSSHASTVMRPDERNDRHDTLHESPMASAVSVHQTRAEQNLHPR